VAWWQKNETPNVWCLNNIPALEFCTLLRAAALLLNDLIV
jgi:hypothetical protein